MAWRWFLGDDCGTRAVERGPLPPLVRAWERPTRGRSDADGTWVATSDVVVVAEAGQDLTCYAVRDGAQRWSLAGARRTGADVHLVGDRYAVFEGPRPEDRKQLRIVVVELATGAARSSTRESFGSPRGWFPELEAYASGGIHRLDGTLIEKSPEFHPLLVRDRIAVGEFWYGTPRHPGMAQYDLLPFRERWTVPGTERPVATDGALLLSTAPTSPAPMIVRSFADGSPLWRIDDPATSRFGSGGFGVAFRGDRLVHTLTPRRADRADRIPFRIECVESRTGRPIWAHTVLRAGQPIIVGDVVWHDDSDAKGRVVLRARALGDGRELAALPLPVRHAAIGVADDLLLVSTGNELSAWRAGG